MTQTFRQILRLVERGEVRISDHSYDELATDGLYVRDVIESVGKAVVVEKYPDYARGPCVLVLQQDRKCARCLEEIESMFTATAGVSKFYREGPGVVVEHNADMVTVERLLEIFRGLPSFYEGRFVPSVLEKPEGQD